MSDQNELSASTATQVGEAIAAAHEPTSAPAGSTIDDAPVVEDPAVPEREEAQTEQASGSVDASSKPNQTSDDDVEQLEDSVVIAADDVLGSSLFNAFSLPPAKITPPKPTESDIPVKPTAALPDNSSPQSSNTLAVGPDGSPAGIIEFESVDWRPEYDERLKHWRHENKVASAKALAKRTEWEAIRKQEAAEAKAAAAKAAKVEVKTVVESEAEAKAGSSAVGSGVAKELGLEPIEVPAVKEGDDEARWKRVGEAWKNAGEPKPKTEADVQMIGRNKVETIDPSVAADPAPESKSFAESSEPLSSTERSVSTSAMPEPGPTASTEEDKKAVPTDIAKTAPADLPIETYLMGSSSLNPPSLTLALFSSKYLPPRRRILLGLACLGVNVLLPFIGGMMAGFGELAAKGIQTLIRETFFLPRSFGTSGVGLSSAPERKNETALHSAERTAATVNPLRSAFP